METYISLPRRFKFERAIKGLKVDVKGPKALKQTSLSPGQQECRGEKKAGFDIEKSGNAVVGIRPAKGKLGKIETLD